MTPVTPKSTGGTPEPEGNARKRRRTALACDECRERKRKCDGVKPVCGSCAKRSARCCVWNEDRPNRAWSNSYVQGLRARIKELEEAQALTNDDYTIVDGGGGSSRGASREHACSTSSPTQPAEFRPVNYAPPTQPHSLLPHPPQPPSSTPSRAVDGYNSGTRVGLDSSLGIGCVGGSGLAVNATPRLSSFYSDGAKEVPSTDARELAIDNDNNSSLEALGSDSGETSVDGMGVVGSLNNTAGRRTTRRPSDYFGPSSTMSLLGKARNILGRRCCGHEPLGSESCHACRDELASLRSSSIAPTSTPGKDSGTKNGNAVFGMTVPPRADADSLLESYWTWVHSLYPFLHRPSFVRRYLSLWSPREVRAGLPARRGPDDYYDGLGDRLFYSLLNVVFAMGALFNPRIDERNRDSVSNSFFDRAKELLDLDLLARGSIPVVQTLLLMGQYLQSTDMSSSCWNIVGMAIRVAQCIGLHYEPKGCEQGCCPKRRYDQLETEMRRRTWTGCVLLDRVLSLTYGRPLMIHPTTAQTQIMLPSAIDDQYLTRLPEPPGFQPGGVPSINDCYVQAVKLQDILGQVLAAFYYAGPDHRSSSSSSVFDFGLNYMTSSVMGESSADGIRNSDFQMLLDVDSLLTTWHKKLPLHHRVNTYQNGGAPPGIVDPALVSSFYRQAVVLEVRYLHVRLTMLRPVLSVLCDMTRRPGNNAATDEDSTEFNMVQGVVLQAAKLCLSVAKELVDQITEHAPSGLCPAPWYNVFYIHSSAMVFLLGYLCSPRKTKIMDEEALVTNFNRCLAFLESYDSRSPSAKNCSKILELVKREVFSNQSANRLSMVDPGVTASTQTAEDRNGEPTMTTDAHHQQQQATRTDFSWRNDDFLLPDFFHDDSRYDQAWMCNSSDVAWLSFVPFLEEAGTEGLSY